MKSTIIERNEIKIPIDSNYISLTHHENTNVFDIDFDFLTKSITIKGYEHDGKLYVKTIEFNDLISIKVIDPKILEKIIKKEPLESDNYWEL